ncbi:DUF1492 domain-containing protein [Brevibacillus sp. IT-7CA2]|uniref:hypothetical protein n=1 Tax=Brevibacillus sp. IT-7CA2 TaxID=3026436 RepID=UPI0039E14F98
MGTMPITVLEQLNRLILDSTGTLDQTKDELLRCDPEDPKAKYLEKEVGRIQERIDFLIKTREEEQARGKIRYVYQFGTVEYFRQSFDDVIHLEHMFITLTRHILEVNESPSKKVRYMESLMKVYGEVSKHA